MDDGQLKQAVMTERELTTLLLAATAHEISADQVNDVLVRVLKSHIQATRDATDHRLSHQGYLMQLVQLVQKWNGAQRWDGEPDIVTRAYAQEVERAMSERPVIRNGRNVGSAAARLLG